MVTGTEEDGIGRVVVTTTGLPEASVVVMTSVVKGGLAIGRVVVRVTGLPEASVVVMTSVVNGGSEIG